MYAFEFVQPATVADAVAALAAEDAQALGGGQTLIPTLRAAPRRPVRAGQPYRHRRHQASPRATAGSAIGGGTTHAHVAREAAAPTRRWRRSRERIGDPAVRNRGTIGGSLANNDPSACYPAGGAGLRRHHRDQPPRDRRRRLLPGHVHHRARAGGDRHRGPLPDPGAGALREVHPARLALPAGRRLRRASSPTGSASRSPAPRRAASSAGPRPRRRSRADFAPEAVKA